MTENTLKTHWYEFRQNNSGGSFIGKTMVVIEAIDHNHANSRAESETDIYFDGVSYDRDCECCGDRWYRVYEKDADRLCHSIEEYKLMDWAEVYPLPRG